MATSSRQVPLGGYYDAGCAVSGLPIATYQLQKDHRGSPLLAAATTSIEQRTLLACLQAPNPLLQPVCRTFAHNWIKEVQKEVCVVWKCILLGGSSSSRVNNEIAHFGRQPVWGASLLCPCSRSLRLQSTLTAAAAEAVPGGKW